MRALRRRRRRGFRFTDRGTLALALLATGSVAAAVALEVRRVWERGSAPLPSETDEPFVAAAEAMHETAVALVEGYRGGTPRENAAFNLLVSFVVSFVAARGVAWRLRTRDSVGPFRNLQLGRRRIHHFVPGIAMSFASGSAAFFTRDGRAHSVLAIPFGAGLGMTLDESALLLELDDVYWSHEGIVGLQITLASLALLSALAIGLRFARRGERMVLHAELPIRPNAPIAAAAAGR